MVDTTKVDLKPIQLQLDSLKDQLSNTNSIIKENHESVMGQLDNIGISDWLLLVIGAVFGLVISVLWEKISRMIKDRKVKTMCSPYEGIYLSYEKYDTKQEPKYFFELRRVKNSFIIQNGISVIGHEDFDAEITMNEPGYKRGVGYYQHKRSPDGVVRFGFLDIQLANGEILVHVTIHKDSKENSDAYRWTKLDYSTKATEEKKYREIQQQKRLSKFSNYPQQNAQSMAGFSVNL